MATFVGCREAKMWFEVDGHSDQGHVFLPVGTVIDVLGPAPITCTSGVDDVILFLAGLGLSKDYTEVVRREHLDGDVFLTLTDEDLTSLGVGAFGDRRKIARGLIAKRPSSDDCLTNVSQPSSSLPSSMV